MPHLQARRLSLLALAVLLVVVLPSCGRKLKTGTANLAEDPPGSPASKPAVAGPDWPGHLGVGRSGISGETIAKSDWSTEPAIAWEAELGTGAASLVVGGGRVFGVGNAGGQDTVRCLDLETGDEVWAVSYPCPLDKRQFEGGPGATPELDPANQRLFVLSHQGELRCLSAADGSEFWKTHLVDDLGGDRPRWGFAGSPLVEGGLVVVDAGGDAGVVALDAESGEPRWKGGGGKAGYAAVVAFQSRGAPAAAIFNAGGLRAVAIEDGRLLFEQGWETSYDVNASTPVYHAGHFFLCSGYGKGGGLVAVTGETPQLVYETEDAVAQFQSPVRVGDHLYLVTGDNSTRSRLVCLRIDNGQLQWSEAIGGNRGNVIVVGDKLLTVTERGEAIVAQVSPEGYEEHGRFQASGGRVWAPPAFSEGRLLVRNNDGELTVWDLR